ncbi:hypothetical protein KXX46_003871 [Aspergillus fumigatus]|nr:hypothetical protein KXX46_003871 [Aspergillus fumigatus]KAH2988888.1 hypothetical protein KXV72_003978 [Aspergillus fumigatus]
MPNLAYDTSTLNSWRMVPCVAVTTNLSWSHTVPTSINPTAPPTTNWRWNEFTQLERLTLDIHLFSNLEGNGWLPFAQTLPASIQDVVILAPRCPPGADMLDFQNMFHDFNPQNFSIFRPINAVATSTLGL